MTETFGATYYRTGNYQNYLQRKFSALCDDIIRASEITTGATIIDFGCGYGGLIHEFMKRGYGNVHGTDISLWSIEYGLEIYPELREHLHHYNRELICQPSDVTLCLDVLEHMPDHEIEWCLDHFNADRLVIRLPVAAKEGCKYVLDVSNNDRTHIACHKKGWWHKLFSERHWIVQETLKETSIYDSYGVLAEILKREV